MFALRFPLWFTPTTIQALFPRYLQFHPPISNGFPVVLITANWIIHHVDVACKAANHISLVAIQFQLPNYILPSRCDLTAVKVMAD